MSIHDCPSCLQLWDVYFKAITEYEGLKRKQKLASAENDLVAYLRLDREIQAAEKTLLTAKQNVNAHDSERHNSGFARGKEPIS